MASCPKCSHEVSDRAAYCDACGAALPGASMSLFELPGEKSGRVARTLVIVVMDLILAGAGVVMILAYLQAREAAAAPLEIAGVDGDAAPRQEPPVKGDVSAEPGRVVKPGQGDPGKVDAARPGSDKPPVPGPDKPPVTTKDPKDPAKDPKDPKDPPPPAPAQTADAGPIKLPSVPLPDAGPIAPPATVVPDAAPAAPPPPVDTGEADAGVSTPTPPPGTSDAEQELAEGVQRTVNARMPQVKRCWENVAKSSADDNVPEGTVEIEFSVLPSGDSANVRVASNDTQSQQLADCVSAIVATWQFPSHEGDPVVFVWPFVFRAAR